jgi:hypothetical protein
VCKISGLVALETQHLEVDEKSNTEKNCVIRPDASEVDIYYFSSTHSHPVSIA